ncbi:putative Ferredoxin-like protein [Shigella flexneri]|nr:putative Ferredoxin-like protein [Shigella flexneri]
MSVARNLWRVADAPHIVPADSVDRKVAYVLTIAAAWSVAPAVCCATNPHYNSGAIRLPDSASPTALDK